MRGTQEIIKGANFAGLPLIGYALPLAGFEAVGWPGDITPANQLKNFSGEPDFSRVGAIPARINDVVARYSHSPAGINNLDTGLLRSSNAMTMCAVVQGGDAWNIAISTERQWEASGSDPEEQREGIMLVVAPVNIVGFSGRTAATFIIRRPRAGLASLATMTTVPMSTELRQSERPYFVAATTEVDGGTGRLRPRVYIMDRDGTLLTATAAIPASAESTAPNGLVEEELAPAGVKRTITIGGMPQRPSTVNLPNNNVGFAAVHRTKTCSADELITIFNSVNKRFAAFGLDMLD